MALKKTHRMLLAVLCGATSAPAIAQSGAPVPAAANEDGGIGDIVVTASRFTESVQRSSTAISVITSDMLDGVTDLRQLQTIDPGVQLGTAGGVTQTFVRGVGSFSLQATQEASVSYTADGIFLFSTTMVTPLMYDLERIEVLKGPQGTLYGRNASGGVVNIITAGARLGKTEGYAEGELGNYELRRVTGALNIPLTSTLAVRLAGQHVEHDGYLSDGTDDQDTTSGRIRLLWEPSSDVSLKLGADATRSRSNGFGASPNPNPTGDKFIGGQDPRLVGTPFGLFSLPPNPPSFWRDDQWSVNAELDVNLGFATLTVLPGYRYQNLRYRLYNPFFENSETPRTRQRTIEVRLANRTDVMKWALGAYYLKVNQTSVSRTRGELIQLDSRVPDYRQSVESYAFFGEGTYSLTPELRVIAGLRYTHERVDNSGSVNNAVALFGDTPAYNPFNPVTNPTGEFGDYRYVGGSRAQAVTWKFGAEYDVGPESMLFVTASRGFKGGGSYVDRPGSDSEFKPEYVTAFEFGSRNRFLDNRLQVNAGMFYWKLKDQQIPFVGYNSGVPPQVVLLVANAGQAHLYGGNLDVVWQATPSDTLRGAVEYLHARYDSFVRVVPSATVITPTSCDLTGFVPGSFAPATLDCSGQQMIRAPKWSASAGYQHRFDLQASGELLADVDMTYASRRAISPEYGPFTIQPGEALINASLTYNTADKGISARAWIRNIGNRRIISGGGASTSPYAQLTLQPPRTYGFSLRYSF